MRGYNHFDTNGDNDLFWRLCSVVDRCIWQGVGPSPAIVQDILMQQGVVIEFSVIGNGKVVVQRVRQQAA